MKYVINIIGKYQLAIGLIALNLALVVLYTPTHYYFEMLQSYAFHLLIILAVVALFFLFTKKWIGTLSVSLAIFLLVNHLPLTGTKSNLSANFHIAHFNVLKLNKSYHKTIEAALKSDANFLSFNEITPEWECVLIEDLKNDYPYYHTQLASNNSFGIAVFSKTPLTNIEVHYWGADFIPSITGYTTILDHPIYFVAAHTISPVTKEYYSIRNKHLDAINNHLQEIEGSKIVIGDLNAVSWSPSITSLREANQLKDSRHNWQPTFPSWLHAIAIPIDHIFHSQDILCTDFSTIKSTDSDHYGIKGAFYMKNHLGSL